AARPPHPRRLPRKPVGARRAPSAGSRVNADCLTGHTTTVLAPRGRLARMGVEASETGRWIPISGASLYCEDRGAGPPIVLIHAGLISRAIWEPLLPALVDEFRVITPDSRGHGRSTNPSGEL